MRKLRWIFACWLNNVQLQCYRFDMDRIGNALQEFRLKYIAVGLDDLDEKYTK